MNIRRWLSLLLVLTLVGILAAQAPDVKDPKEGENPNLAPKPAAEVDPATQEKNHKEIMKHYDEAEKNYDSILGREKESTIETMEGRIDNNRKLLTDQSGKLTKAQSDIRRLRLIYLNQCLRLQNELKEGKIDQKIYDKKIAELSSKYQFDISDKKQDVSYYSSQKGETQDRLKKLGEETRLQKILLEQEQKDNPPPPAEEKPQRKLTDLEQFMARIQGMSCFKPQFIWDAPEIK